MTPQEREDKRAFLVIDRLGKALKSQFSFGIIKTYEDLLKAAGIDVTPYFPSELQRKITFKDVSEFLSDRKIELSTAIWLRNNPPIVTTHDKTTTVELIPEQQNTPSDIRTITRSGSEDSYKDFKASPNEKAFFFWFQKKAITQLMEGILGERIL